MTSTCLAEPEIKIRWSALIRAADEAVMPTQFALEQAEGEYRLKALIPGAREGDVCVDARSDRLRVCGMAQSRYTDGHHLAYVRREQVDEVFNLPADADGGAATWTYLDGVTTITIPRRPRLDEATTSDKETSGP